jgi:murein L,D-transpeptidase YafK
MNKILWLIAGVAIGAVAARQINENPQARKAYEEAKASLQEFADAVAEGYKERETQLTKPTRKTTAKTSRKSSTEGSTRSTAKKPAAKSKPAGK